MFTFHAFSFTPRQANIALHLKMKVDSRKTPDKENKFLSDINYIKKRAPFLW
jgi:hypothetical protein